MGYLADAFKEAREYGDWVYRKAPLSKLNAAERAMRRKYQKSVREMYEKYSPLYDAYFSKEK